MTYNHAITLAIAIPGCQNPDGPTVEEALPALLRRVAELLTDSQEAREALLTDVPFDTYEED